MNNDRSIRAGARRWPCRLLVPLVQAFWAAAALTVGPAVDAQGLEPADASGAPWSMVLLATALATVGLYHLQVYLRRRESGEYLWFAAAVFHLVAVILLQYRLRDLISDPVWLSRLREAAMHLVLPVLIQFTWKLLARPRDGRVRAYLISHLALAAATLTASGQLLTATQTGRWIWGLPGWIVLAAVFAGELGRRSFEARVIGLGGSALALTGLVGWGGRILGWQPLLPWPFAIAAVFAMATALLLSWRFHRIHLELGDLRLRLEEMVEDRTHEIEAANDRLHSELAEQRLAEEAMRMLERGVEQSIDGIVVTDLRGKIEFATQAWARMHGYEVIEVLGRNLSLFHSAEQMEEELRPCLEQVQRVGSFEGEIEHLKKDGCRFPTWMSLTLLNDEDGPVGIAGVGRDISERRRDEREQRHLENKLQQARRLESLGNLACAIANDYNNMLTPVVSNATVLLRDAEPGSALYDRVRLIEAAADRAADLTTQLLAYAGEDRRVMRTIDLGDLIREMQDRLERQLATGAALQLDLCDRPTPVAADAAQARRVIHNLVSNASEALDGRPGTITLRTRWVDVGLDDFRDADLDEARVPGRYVMLEVADTGRGITDEVRTKMFDPFYSTRPSARGLGLATVFGIVRGHRGAIKVRSRPGRGTSMRLLFPILETPATAVDRSPAVTAEYHGSGKVLVVDDEELIREVSEWILEESGFQVLTAADGIEALELFRRDSALIRVVLLDNHMPKMDGEAVLRELHRLEPQARVILMSGYPEKEVTRNMADLGLSGFLKKPFRPDDLMGKVRQVLEA
jgi:PAS domain S-box-containing protein